MDNKNDHHQSRFLEAPFIRMLRMRSASLTIFSDTLKIVNDSYLNMQCFFWFYIHTRHIHISYLENSTYSGVKKPIVYIDWLWSEFSCTYLHSRYRTKILKWSPQGLLFQGLLKGQESKSWVFFEGPRRVWGPQKSEKKSFLKTHK